MIDLTELSASQRGLIVALVFLFGASVGSFLNVVILRLPKGLSIVRPGSHCPRCGYVLTWKDNIPILSYLLLAGKCRSCRLPISVQYPLIELLGAALAVAMYVRFGLSAPAAIYFLFAAALVAVTFIDIPYQIIPNEISLPGILAGVLASFAPGMLRWQDSAIGAVAGFLIVALLVYGYYFLFKREGMGMGDAKLLAMIGAFLGWQSIPFILLASSVQGLAVALLAIGTGLMKKAPPRPDPDEETAAPPAPDGAPEEVPLRLAAVPFGPFLSLAALEYIFLGAYYLEFLSRM